MPISGTFRSQVPRITIKTMMLNEKRYFLAKAFLVSGNKAFLNLHTEVYEHKDEVNCLNLGPYASVFKINEDNNQHSFVINLNADPTFCLLSFDSLKSYDTKALESSKNWVCFSNVDVYIDEIDDELDYGDIINIEKDLIKTDVITEENPLRRYTLKELNQELDKAVVSENYMYAASLRDEIQRRN